MNSPIDSLTGMPLPAMSASATAASTRPNARGAAPAGDFDRLMGLQQRAQDMSRKAREASSKPDAQDPAREAARQQQLHHADELDRLRELVGPNPGSNTRHAFAAILDRGSPAQPRDVATIRLAQAADAGRIPPAAGTQLRATIAALAGAMEALGSAAADPQLVQDPARVAQHRERMRSTHAAFEELTKLLGSGDAASAAPRLAAAAEQENPGHVVRDVLAVLRRQA